MDQLYKIDYFIIYSIETKGYAGVLVHPLKDIATSVSEFLPYKTVQVENQNILVTALSLGKTTTMREICSENCYLSATYKVVHEHPNTQDTYWLDSFNCTK